MLVKSDFVITCQAFLAESVNAEYHDLINPPSVHLLDSPPPHIKSRTLDPEIVNLCKVTVASWERQTVRISHVDRQLVQVATLLLCQASFILANIRECYTDSLLRYV